MSSAPLSSRPRFRNDRRIAVCCAVLQVLLAATPTAAAPGGTVRVEIRDPKGAPVADAVASMMPLERKPAITPPAGPVVITQQNEEFIPYVTAIVAGTRIAFPNRDKVQHHVYSLSKPKRFDIPLYRGDSPETIVFDQPGVVTIGCNLHDWMSAHIVVLATPHFARSGADGTVLLSGLEPGRHRLEVWHPRVAATVTRDVDIISGDAATQVIAVTLRPDRRIRRAPETGSAGYR